MGFKINLFILVVFSMFSMGYYVFQNPLHLMSYVPFVNFLMTLVITSESKVFPKLEQKRFWFSKKAKNCVPFDYKGCGGNGNNFKTYEECTKACNTTYLQ